MGKFLNWGNNFGNFLTLLYVRVPYSSHTWIEVATIPLLLHFTPFTICYRVRVTCWQPPPHPATTLPPPPFLSPSLSPARQKNPFPPVSLARLPPSNEAAVHTTIEAVQAALMATTEAAFPPFGI